MASQGERQQFYADIVTTAVEGGIGYWSYADQYRWFSPTIKGGTCVPGPDGSANAYAVLVPNADPESTLAPWPIDETGGQRAYLGVAVVRRAVGQIVRGDAGQDLKPELIAAVKRAYREWDAGEIDADLADIIAQIGIFGRVIFG